jgi:hypothetical protein
MFASRRNSFLFFGCFFSIFMWVGQYWEGHSLAFSLGFFVVYWLILGVMAYLIRKYDLK